jgi:hypothetical protein
MKKEPRPDTGSNRIVRSHSISRFKPDNRRNEWSPMPAGGIIAAFTMPVAIVFFWGAVFHADEGMEWLYAGLSALFGLIVLISACDAAYIAGMRRIADQDLGFKDDPPPKRIQRDTDFGNKKDRD